CVPGGAHRRRSKIYVTVRSRRRGTRARATARPGSQGDGIMRLRAFLPAALAPFPVLALVLAVVTAPAPAAGAGVPVDLELVLGVDISGSVDEAEGALQRDGYVSALRDPRVVAAIRGGFLGRIAVSYFEWADDRVQAVAVGWTLIDGEAGA